MRICMTLDPAAFNETSIIPRQRQARPEFGGSGYIDDLYQATMDSKQGPDEALDSLWGPVLTDSLPTHIYVEGAIAKGKKNCPAGAGVYLGPDSFLIGSFKVPGPERPTADRARLFAMHEAIRLAPENKTLLVFCTSKMIIRQLCYCAAKNSQLGWPGKNGDIFESLVNLLAGRKAATCFAHIDSKANNDAKRTAYSLAKSALNRGGPDADFVPSAPLPIPLPVDKSEILPHEP